MFTGYTKESDFLTKPKLSKKKESDNIAETSVEETNQERIFHTKRSPLERLPSSKRADVSFDSFYNRFYSINKRS